MQGTEIGHDDEIRQIAYNIWQEEGCPDGHEVQHWLKAESIWLQGHRPQSEHKESMSLKTQPQVLQRAVVSDLY